MAKKTNGLTYINQKDLTDFLRDIEERIRARAEREALASPKAKQIARELVTLRKKLSPLQDKADALRERLREEFNLTAEDDGSLSVYARYARAGVVQGLLDTFEALKSEIKEARLLNDRERIQAAVRKLSALAGARR